MKRQKTCCRNNAFPGPKAQAVLRQGKRYYATTTVASEIVPAKAKSATVWDLDGNEYIDFVAGVGVSNVGFGNPEVIKAVTEHLRKTGIMNFIHHDFYNPWTTKLAEGMARRMECCFKKRRFERRFKMFFANSGAEIVEAALKLVWANRPDRQKIIGFKAAFHGRTFGACGLLTREAHIKDYPAHLRPLFAHLTYPRDARTFELFKEELGSLNLAEFGAIFMEVIQGEGGLQPLFPPAAEFINRELVEKADLYLVVDEVQTGNARTGKYMAFEHYPHLNPAVILTAKGVASGVPFAAMWFDSRLDWRERGRHSSTYGGNALAVIAASATYRYLIKHKLINHAEKLGGILRAELMKLEAEFFCIRHSRGIGLMQGFDVVDESGEFDVNLRNALEKEAPHWGLILMSCGQSGIRILPPLVITEEELREGLNRLRHALKHVLSK